MGMSWLGSQARAAFGRLRGGLWPVTQAAVAAGLAWFLARDVLGHPQPFFAPMAAAMSLSASNVYRAQRAVQMIAGVTLGIGVGEGINAVLSGPPAIAAATLTALSVALVLGGGFFGQGLMFVNQTAASAVLVIALHQSSTGIERLVDALIGGGVVLVISVVLFPANPLVLLDRASHLVIQALADALADLHRQVETRQPDRAAWLLGTGQLILGTLGQLAQNRGTARHIVMVAPRRWPQRGAVDAAIERSGGLELLSNAILGLLRVGHALLSEPEVPDELLNAVGPLSTALGRLAEHGLDAGLPPAIMDSLRRLADQPKSTRTPLLAELAGTCARDVLWLVQPRRRGDPLTGIDPPLSRGDVVSRVRRGVESVSVDGEPLQERPG
jgi:uncharacterized membrane protein YgaE (UPF0421/DUF939 family)